MIPPDLYGSLLESWDFFVHLAVTLLPLFVVASFLVGLAKEYLPPERVEAMLRGHDEGLGNVAAAALGAATPFCSCSTVPVLAGLLQAGAPLGMAFSFLLASPLVNLIAVILLAGWFGIEVTVWYVLTTFTAAVLGGIVIGRLGLREHVKDVSLGGDSGAPVATDGGTAGCCDRASPTPRTTHRQHVETAARKSVGFLRDMLPYLLLGMTVGALIHGVVPVSVLNAVLGDGNPLSLPTAAVAGAPVYVSLSGMLPIAASLNAQGIQMGTILAFVIGGAGVSVPNLILLHKLFDRRLLVIYAATVVAVGILVGGVFNTVVV